ncbi:MAG: hypothetical protein EA339_04545 [Rhodobacteraceae bacterium]|nr:MAG: hypothetical protein EA339_04545 [Paracoccaceae bacterium]
MPQPPDGQPRGERAAQWCGDILCRSGADRVDGAARRSARHRTGPEPAGARSAPIFRNNPAKPGA